MEINEIFSEGFSLKDNVIHLKLLIGGKWEEASEYVNIYSPIDQTLVAKIPVPSKDQVEKALNEGIKAEGLISSMPLFERLDILSKFKEQLILFKENLARVLMKESGKTYNQAVSEIESTILRLNLSQSDLRAFVGEYIRGDIASDKLHKFAIVLREPLGLVLGISPFNYPFFTSYSKVIPAILAGNPIIIKPPSADPVAFILSTVLLNRLLPPGVVQVLTVPGSAMDSLVSDPRIKVISFTGSTAVGKHIAKLAGDKKLHLELGGKGTAIVLENADLSLAAKEIVKGSISLSGQRCDAVSRVLVVEKVKDKFLELVKAELNNYKLGNPELDNSANLGPVISKDASARINGMVKDAVSKGAKLIYGGSFKDTYHDITLLSDVPLSATIANEETFGPVITIITVKDKEDAIKIANQSNYGLDSCVFTNDINEAYECARRLNVGSVTINAAPSHGSTIFPFGGVKDSGIGKEGIVYSIKEMTYEKTIVFNLNNDLPS
ncbi:MAG: aldehyde dehydrogenase family protein [Candidatus Rehaiarchaeum fermentans]|nr:aldehyde dehydrogenase family protein [Candidatus Rehaiarchaeum fermentans]